MALTFPRAQTAQIIRAHQRDVMDVASLRQQTDDVLRALIGTRQLTRWLPEVNLVTRLMYYGLTTGAGIQTLGEEYTDVWQHGPPQTPSHALHALLVLLPSLPAYLLSRLGGNLSPDSVIRRIPLVLEVLSEINLAVFYLRGTFYDLTKRVLGVKYRSTIPESPYMKPPSYSLLGILLGVRLVHRFVSYLRLGTQTQPSREHRTLNTHTNKSETYIDDRAVSDLLAAQKPDGADDDASPPRAEDDSFTWMNMGSVPDTIRAGRTCTLCLEERTATTATECGHLFCWNCIVGWAREKAECPLCRQSLNITRLAPIYNL